MKRLLTLTLILGILPACASLGKIGDTVEDVRAKVEAVRTEVSKIDANKDGEITRGEIVSWATGGGLASLLAALGFISARKRREDHKHELTESRVRELEQRKT